MAFCSNCGTELAEGAKFCANCGTAVAVVEKVQKNLGASFEAGTILITRPNADFPEQQTVLWFKTPNYVEWISYNNKDKTAEIDNSGEYDSQTGLLKGVSDVVDENGHCLSAYVGCLRPDEYGENRYQFWEVEGREYSEENPKIYTKEQVLETLDSVIEEIAENTFWTLKEYKEQFKDE